MTDSPAALRRSLESRFKNASRATGQPSPLLLLLSESRWARALGDRNNPPLAAKRAMMVTMKSDAMPVEDVISIYGTPGPVDEERHTPAQDWRQALAYIEDDPRSRRLLDELIDDIRTNGQDEPIVLIDAGCNPEDDFDTHTGKPDCCPAVVNHGFWRTLAHLRAGWQTIATTTTPARQDNTMCTEAVLILRDKLETRELEDDFHDHIFTRLSSFRHDPTTWMRSSVAYPNEEQRTYTMVWDNHITTNLPGLAETVVSRLTVVNIPAPEGMLFVHSSSGSPYDPDAKVAYRWPA